MTEIKGDELREVLMQDGHKLVDYDRQIGYADGYFKNCCRKGKINGVGYNFLTDVLDEKGLNIDDYVVKLAIRNNSKRVKVDEDIINRYLKAHHMTRSEMSLGIGRARSHISNILTGDGTIARCDYLAIKNLYGIDIEKKPNNITDGIENVPTKPKDWQQVAQETTRELAKQRESMSDATRSEVYEQNNKPKAHKKVTVKDTRPVTELTADELSRLIYRSIYSAIKHCNIS